MLFMEIKDVGENYIGHKYTVWGKCTVLLRYSRRYMDKNMPLPFPFTFLPCPITLSFTIFNFGTFRFAMSAKAP